jgi:hypothetical protein
MAVVGECASAGYRRLMCVLRVLQRGILCVGGYGGRTGDLVVLVCYMVSTSTISSQSFRRGHDLLEPGRNLDFA